MTLSCAEKNVCDLGSSGVILLSKMQILFKTYLTKKSICLMRLFMKRLYSA